VCVIHSRDVQGHTDLPLIDEVCKLCRSTGYAPGQPKPPKYPEDYFKRYYLARVRDVFSARSWPVWRCGSPFSLICVAAVGDCCSC
jgi:hypothetical protein